MDVILLRQRGQSIELIPMAIWMTLLHQEVLMALAKRYAINACFAARNGCTACMIMVSRRELKATISPPS